MPNAPAISRPDVEGIAARADAATDGPWQRLPMGGDSYVLTKTHKSHKPLPLDGNTLRGYSIAVPRPVLESDGKWDYDRYSAGFAHDDAKFIAHARQDIPALIEYLLALEAAGIAVLMETDFAIRPASGEPIVAINNKHGTAHRKQRDILAGLPVPEALAALGDE